MYIYSPLEQFCVLPILNIFNIFEINNVLITLFLISTFLIIYNLSVVSPASFSVYLLPNRWQLIFEFIYFIFASLIKENINSNDKSKLFPIIISIFFFILNLNLFGIIPYSFTISSQLIVVFSVSLSLFIGIQVIAIKIHKIKYFSLFFPSGISVVLSLLLVPIELISFFFKPISLSIRLFANMMAGHTLLKVFTGFIWTIMNISGIFSASHIILLILFVVLFFFEASFAIIQAFVFSMLICIYLSDIFNLH